MQVNSGVNNGPERRRPFNKEQKTTMEIII